MLEEIGKLPIEEQSQYKDVILSMFDRRMTSNKVRDKALEVAKNNGFKEELNKVIKETGEGGYSARNGVRDEMYVIDKAGDYIKVDFSPYKGVIVEDDFNDKIELCYNITLRGFLNLKGTKNIDLTKSDLSKVTKIMFEEGAKVNLWRACNLPDNLDVSMCNKVDLTGCDLSKIKALKFKEGSKVILYNASILPTNLDVSMCDYVDLSFCDLEGINLKFKDMATVNLGKAKNLSKDLDVSMCDGVIMKDADISNLKELKFKNEKQMKDSQVKIPEDWKGKIIYTDDEKLAPVISRGNDGR